MPEPGDGVGPRLCRLGDIPDGAARGFAVTPEMGPDMGPDVAPGVPGGRLDLLVARRGEHVHGYLNVCPHAGTPLDWVPDQFMSADGRHLQCATHGAQFGVEDGTCLSGPCRGKRLSPVALRVEDGWIRLAGRNEA